MQFLTKLQILQGGKNVREKRLDSESGQNPGEGAVRCGAAERSAGAQRTKIMLSTRRSAARPCMASGALNLARRGTAAYKVARLSPQYGAL